MAGGSGSIFLTKEEPLAVIAQRLNSEEDFQRET